MTRQVNMHLSDAEFLILAKAAEAAGVGPTGYARRLLAEALQTGLALSDGALKGVRRGDGTLIRQRGGAATPREAKPEVPHPVIVAPKRPWRAPELVELAVPVTRAAEPPPEARRVDVPAAPEHPSAPRRRAVVAVQKPNQLAGLSIAGTRQPVPLGRSLTAAIMGDPPPGRSALDEKRSQRPPPAGRHNPRHPCPT